MSDRKPTNKIMKQYIAAIIHNNSLGQVLAVESEEQGKDVLRVWAKEQFNRPLTQDEEESLENELEIYNDEDADNAYSFSIGIVGEISECDDLKFEIDLEKEAREAEEYKTAKRCAD